MDVNSTLQEIRQILGTDVADENFSISAMANVSLSSGAKKWLSALKGADLLIPWSAEDLHLYGNCASLSEGQIGYRVDVSGNRLAGWHDDWLVLGGISGDPIIGKANGDGLAVLFARHGGGAWRAEVVSDTVDEFAVSLKIWCDIFIQQYSKDIYDDTLAVRSDFLAELKGRIGKVLPEDKANVFISMVDG